jgi:hypothetical protein
MIEIKFIGGTKKYREALKKKIAEELDPKGILDRPTKTKPKKRKQ